MKKYWLFFKQGLQVSLAHRYQKLIEFIMSFISTSILIYVWFLLTKENGTIGGYNFEDFAVYYLLGVAVSFFKGTNIMYLLDRWVREGQMSGAALRPWSMKTILISNAYSHLFGNLLSKFPAFLVAYTLVFVLFDLYVPSLQQIVIIIPFLFIVYTLNYFWEFMWGLIVFFSKDAGGYKGIVWNIRNVLTGSMIPLDLLPGWMVSALLVLPFANGYFLPIQFLMGRADLTELLSGLGNILIWMLVFFVGTSLIWKRAMKNFEGVGI